MSNYIAKLHTRLLAAMGDSERGSVSLEQVIITAGLAALAVAVIAGIGALVKSHLGSIA